MQPTYDLIESPDDGGWYAEFWDYQTGKSIVNADGDILHTDVYPERYRTNKAAKCIIRNADWMQYNLQAGLESVCEMMFVPGEKRREYWTFCSDKCAKVFWDDQCLKDAVWIGKQDLADLFPGCVRHITVQCDTCHRKELSTRGYTPDEDTNPTDIIWWWER